MEHRRENEVRKMRLELVEHLCRKFHLTRFDCHLHLPSSSPFLRRSEILADLMAAVDDLPQVRRHFHYPLNSIAFPID